MPVSPDIDQLTAYLGDVGLAAPWLKTLGLVHPERAHADLARMAGEGIPPDLMTVIAEQLAAELPQLSDADMALGSLERFVAAVRSPLALASLFERDQAALPTLLQIFSTSQYLSDVLVSDTESYDLLRMAEGAPVARDDLIADLWSEVEAQPDEIDVLTTLRRYKRRETLRIAYGDIALSQRLETVTSQISYLADAIVEAALRTARRNVEAARGTPRGPDGKPARFVVLALGKLGGMELNYSSDIDLVLLYDVDGQTDGQRSLSNQEFFVRTAREMVRLLAETTPLGSAYRVDLRLRPDGSQGPITGSLDGYLQYYDVKGRTWERQAYVKARPIAGDLELGHAFLDQLKPWIYRRYLSRADIIGIKSLKRKIEQKTDAAGTSERDVKTGHGGIRDIEFAIQFLQLVNGATLPQLQTGNTLDAIALLEQEGCLTPQERSILEKNYRFLRKVEHRLQIMFDLQTHLLPDNAEEMRKLAIRMGYAGPAAREEFESDLVSVNAENRRILDHLLHDAFGESDKTEPEVDLVNDPYPPPARIREVLAAYPFRDVDAAYHNLMALATEKIRFLSTRRCRYFLASIAPRLLRAIAATPDPDATLVDLVRVSDSLGGKAVLWELFSFNPPSLKLYVKLCAAAPYLSGILTSNPGMIDELLDSLLLEHLPTLESLKQSLTDLCRGAEDIDPILHSFKDAQHLRVGIRDILGKDDIRDTHATLSDIAETCLRQISMSEYTKLTEKFGHPTIGQGRRAFERCELIILALGKLGGREPNYHSDLDVVFLYEADGTTAHRRSSSRDRTTTNQHFFGELGQRIMKIANHLGPYGRLFEVDPRLRPTGRSGTLAVPIDEFRRYFAEGDGQLWERQALCKARIIFGSPRAAAETMSAVADAAFGPPWRPEYAAEIRHMRERLEDTAGKRNLKRGMGGTVDVEFVVQMLQLKHGGKNPDVRVPGTLDAIDALHEHAFMKDADFEHFSRAYRFLRSVEAGIRLMNSSGRHEMPSDETERRRLAYLLGYADVQTLLDETEKIITRNRARFERIFDDNTR